MIKLKALISLLPQGLYHNKLKYVSAAIAVRTVLHVTVVFCFVRWGSGLFKVVKYYFKTDKTENINVLHILIAFYISKVQDWRLSYYPVKHNS